MCSYVVLAIDLPQSIYMIQAAFGLSPLVSAGNFFYALPVTSRPAPRYRNVTAISIAILVSALPLFAQDGSWTHYGGDAGGMRYSPLKQITPSSVNRLKVAWTYHTGALGPPASRMTRLRLRPPPF